MGTETANTLYRDIDRWPTAQAVEAMLSAQHDAVAAIDDRIDALSQAAQAAAARLGRDGRLAYSGAGTSGRVGVQDGVELTPTFGWPESRLVFLLAGGEAALMRAIEGAEDDAQDGADQVRAQGLSSSDVLIAVAASGATPFTLGTVKAARDAGALTIALANNPDAPLLAAAEHAILLDTGSEAIAGSTRMKAGTAQKVALNLLSTAIMLRMGLVYRGRMVAMRISNAKLRRRAVAMVEELAGVEHPLAAAALDAAQDDIRLAVMIATGIDPDLAARKLEAANGALGLAIEGDAGR